MIVFNVANIVERPSMSNIVKKSTLQMIDPAEILRNTSDNQQSMNLSNLCKCFWIGDKSESWPLTSDVFNFHAHAVRHEAKIGEDR